MRHGSLFSGIGGFDIAAEWMGWENVFHCEINGFCQKVLKHYWPDAKSYTDITKTDFTGWRGKVDIISGGFPCQPYSVAGKRKGKDDDRHLWPEMLRAIREIQPRWVVGENVPGLLNWRGGMVLDEIKADLEAAGFEVLPPLILPACGKNAPHRRDRLWIVAYSEINRQQFWACNRSQERQTVKGEQGGDYEIRSEFIGHSRITPNSRLLGQEEHEIKTAGIEQCDKENVANTINQGSQGNKFYETLNKRKQQQESPGSASEFFKGEWSGWPTQSPVCSGNDGLPGELAGITVSKHRKESLMAYGNSIVPQVVYEIFKAIEQVEISTHHNV